MKLSLDKICAVNVRYSLLRDKNITTSQAFLISLFMDIDISKGIPSNKELARFFGVEKNSISNNISYLVKKRYLVRTDRLSDLDAYNKLNFENSDSGCLFCGFAEVTLDQHHYPTRAKHGGYKTIRLCPNCHRKFHEVTDYSRNITINTGKCNG